MQDDAFEYFLEYMIRVKNIFLSFISIKIHTNRAYKVTDNSIAM
jgi:hypothetical protein